MAWSDIGLFNDMGGRLQRWQTIAAVREFREASAMRKVQRAWRRHRERRQLVQPTRGRAVTPPSGPSSMTLGSSTVQVDFTEDDVMG